MPQHRKTASKIAALVLAVALATPALSAQVFTGTTVGGPTFNRPVAGSPPTSLSGVGTSVSYAFLNFTVSVTGNYNFLSEAIAPINWDNYLFLYQNSFDASAPLSNGLIGNDDYATIGRSGFDFALNAGTTYVLVTTGFGNTDQGIYRNTIRGQGVATPTSTVPEPSTNALMAAGLIGVAVVTKRRRGRNKA